MGVERHVNLCHDEHNPMFKAGTTAALIDSARFESNTEPNCFSRRKVHETTPDPERAPN